MDEAGYEKVDFRYVLIISALLDLAYRYVVTGSITGHQSIT